jgi:hypothetical protein
MDKVQKKADCGGMRPAGNTAAFPAFSAGKALAFHEGFTRRGIISGIDLLAYERMDRYGS